VCQKFVFTLVCIGVCVCLCNDSGSLIRQTGPSKAGSATPADDEVDPRLKNFEPRMVELIISEVLKCLFVIQSTV